jgi:hypothetical protein
MQRKKGIVCSIVIICFLVVQLPTTALAKYVAVDKTAQVTRNAPQFKTTTPEPIATTTSKKEAKKSTLLWGLVGLAAVAGLVAAVMSGGSGGGGGGGDNRETNDTGSVTVEW